MTVGDRAWRDLMRNEAKVNLELTSVKPSAESSPVAANAEIERLNHRLAETGMLAHKWMVRHDRVVAGLDGGDFPKPADLPDAVATLTARVAELEAGLKLLADCGTAVVGADPFDPEAREAFDMWSAARLGARALLQKDKNHE